MAKQKGVTLVPLADKILVRRVTPEEKTIAGLIIPQTAQEMPSLGVVMAVGPKGSLKSGQQVMWEKFAGIEIKLDGNEYVVIREDEILGTVKE